MKRVRLVFVLVVLLLATGIVCPPHAGALSSTGDPGWYWQAPLPFGWGASCVDWGDTQNVWVASRQGLVMHSADTGLTWTTAWPGFGDIEDISFADAQNGWAISGDYNNDSSSYNALVRTDDGGDSWSKVTVPVDGAVLSAVDFADALDGYAVGYVSSGDLGQIGLLLSTSDGGTTWHVKRTYRSQPRWGWPELTDVVAVDAQHAWAGGDSGRIRVTSDGGVTWVARNIPSYQSIRQIVAFDAQHAVVHAGYDFYTTSDGGMTWSKMAIPDLGSWVWLTVDRDRLVVTWTEYWDDKWGTATILTSDDFGATFSRSYVGDDYLAFYQAYSSEGTGIAVGASLWRRPAGEDWQRMATGPGYALNDVDFTDASHGWAVGLDTPFGWGQFIDPTDQGRILHTDDGVTWSEQQVPDGPGLTSVCFVDDQRGWVGGAAGRIVHTTDGGATWTDQDAGFTGTVEDVAFVDDTDGWAACSGTQIDSMFTDEVGAILKTTDGGVSWTATKMPYPVELKSLCFVTALDGWAAGQSTPWRESSYLLHTDDGGATWQRVDVPHIGPLSYVTFVDEQHGWVLGGSYDSPASTVLRTADGGETWTRTNLPYPQAFSEIQMVDSQHGWAGGSAMFQTADGGATWQQVARIGGAFDVVDATHIWAVGGAGVIVSTVDTAADTASPATVDDGDRQIRRHDVTVHLRAIDIGGSSVERTEYRIDGERAWREGDEYTFFAPLSHLGDGAHWLSYRSVDSAGNVERTHECRVTIDTTGPTTDVWGFQKLVAMGSRVRIPYIVNDALSQYATAKLVIERAIPREPIVRRIRMGSVRTNQKWRFAWRVNLPRGRYLFHVEATDQAGNRFTTYGEEKSFTVW